MPKTCGTCKWYVVSNDYPQHGDCSAPVPMAVTENQLNLETYCWAIWDATDCPCFRRHDHSGG